MGLNQTEIRCEAQNRQLAICASVRAALRQDRLLFAFQPVVCAASGRIDYFECLLRMRDLEGSIVAGGEFIPTLEALGLIGFIDNYVLDQTLRELAKYPDLKLGLNISSLTACEGAWLTSLTCMVRYRPDMARRLVVEITETAALGDLEESARFVATLHKAGCRVALDDFGAGHTSARHLQVLAADTVKIDGSFVRNLTCSHEQRLRLRDLLDLVKSFGCATVAEGIENAGDAALVRAEGIGYLQGYHLGAPTTARTWLRTASANTAELPAPRSARTEPMRKDIGRW